MCFMYVPPQTYSPEMRDFMVKVVQRSGLSQKGTYLPPAIHPQHAAEVSQGLVGRQAGRRVLAACLGGEASLACAAFTRL